MPIPAWKLQFRKSGGPILIFATVLDVNMKTWLHKVIFPALRFTCFCCIVICLCVGCANPIPPTGGPKDTTPPGIIEDESTPNYLTEFNRSQIVLTFDEWIQLRDPSQQIVISPPLNRRPNFILKGKSVIVELPENEELREQTTYTISFGEAIVDLNESTPLDQFKYVFSTGTFIDSLEIHGTLIHAETKEPAKGVYIVLHDNLADTAFTKLLPTYFTKTDDAGRWHIENVRSDTFHVYALVDLNVNYKYDQPGESIGFLDSLVILPDTNRTNYTISLFTEEPQLIVLDVNKRTAGVAKIQMNAASERLLVSQIDPLEPVLPWNIVKDTILVWNPGVDTVSVSVLYKDEALDTIQIPPFPGEPLPENDFRMKSKSVLPREALAIMCRIPVYSANATGAYVIFQDSIFIEPLEMEIDSSDNRRALIRGEWTEPGSYRLFLPPGAVTDIFETTHDTLLMPFQIAPPGNLGQLFVAVDSLDADKQYVVQVQLGKSETIDEFVISDEIQGRGSFSSMAPQTYSVRVIEDLNRNGRWDTGNFAQQRQPERVLIQTLEPLRAGWDLEVTITWK